MTMEALDEITRDCFSAIAHASLSATVFENE